MHRYRLTVILSVADCSPLATARSLCLPAVEIVNVALPAELVVALNVRFVLWCVVGLTNVSVSVIVRPPSAKLLPLASTSCTITVRRPLRTRPVTGAKFKPEAVLVGGVGVGLAALIVTGPLAAMLLIAALLPSPL